MTRILHPNDTNIRFGTFGLIRILGSIKNMKGFTLIELLIVIGIGLILALASVPIYGSLQESAQLNETKAQMVQVLRTGRERASLGLNDSNHGVYFDFGANPDSYTLYQGDSYLTRNADYDQTFELSNSLHFINVSFDLISSDVDINFVRNTAIPNNTGSLNIIHVADNDFRAISLSDLGKVE